MSGLASAYFYLHRRTVQGMFRKHVKDALENDLKDPVGAYGLRRSDDLPGFEPTGPAGFWIAEYGGEIIGFVTLSNSFMHIATGPQYLTFFSDP